MLKISVITINYNNKPGLKKTIESVINQTYRDLEYIVIDGNSTDGSIELLKHYDTKIGKWISEPDKGIYNAMNKGIKQANGDYCLFLNSGDYLANKYVLERVFSSEINADIIYGDIINDYHTNKVEVSNPKEKYITFRHFINSTLPHPSTFIKRDLFQRIGLYDEQLSIAADWKFFIQAICKYNATIKKINFAISIFDMHGISSSRTQKSIIEKERKDVLNDEFFYFMQDYNYLDKLEKLFFVKFWYWLKKLKVKYLGKSIKNA